MTNVSRPAVQVCIDGCDIATMDRHFLRDQIGLVSQEPVLFSCRSVLQQCLHSHLKLYP